MAWWWWWQGDGRDGGGNPSRHVRLLTPPRFGNARRLKPPSLHPTPSRTFERDSYPVAVFTRNKGELNPLAWPSKQTPVPGWLPQNPLSPRAFRFSSLYFSNFSNRGQSLRLTRKSLSSLFVTATICERNAYSREYVELGLLRGRVLRRSLFDSIAGNVESIRSSIYEYFEIKEETSCRRVTRLKVS